MTPLDPRDRFPPPPEGQSTPPLPLRGGALPQPRDVAIPDFTSDTYASFGLQITGDITAPANMGALWEPQGARFVLRGGYILALCIANLGGASASAVLSLHDETFAQAVMPLGIFSPSATLVNEPIVAAWPSGATAGGTGLFAVPYRFDLGRGYRSRAANNRLLVGGTASIGAGVIYVAGLVWGVQVP